MLHRDLPVIVERRCLVHRLDRIVGLLAASVEDVGEATGRLRLLVLDDIDLKDRAKLGEDLAHLVLGRAQRYTGDIDVAVVLGINHVALSIDDDLLLVRLALR